MGRISVTENRVLMAQARECLRGKWGLAIGSFVVFVVVAGFAQIVPFVGEIVTLLISGPLTLGWAIFALSLARNEDTRLEMVFDGFRLFGPSLAVYLLAAVCIILWSLLLIVPGIIAALAYSQVYYIMADSKTIGPLEAIRRSKEMMRGNKWKFFCLGLRFVGWAFLCVLTFGIGFLWLYPYVAVATAKFYDDLRHDAQAPGIDAPGPLF